MAPHKQRLKAWYAQLLLTHDAPLQTRDVLLSRMQKSVSTLNAFCGGKSPTTTRRPCPAKREPRPRRVASAVTNTGTP